VRIIGSKDTLAIALGPQDGQTKLVEVWVGGANLSQQDSAAYLPSFLPALQATERALKARLNYLQHEGPFLGLGVEEAFIKLRDATSAELENAWSKLRFADWGPTTDECLCFLLPVQGRLYVACQRPGLERIHHAQITPYDLIRTLEGSIHEIALQTGA